MMFLKHTLILVAALVVIFIGTLAVNGSVRHTVFRSAIELPGIATYFRLRRPIIERNFKASARLLNTQLDMVKGFVSGQNNLLPGLIANTRYVMREVKLKSDGIALEPYLVRLAAYRPGLFLAHLWLAEAVLHSDPKRAIKVARVAQKLIPADDRPYRIAAQAAMILGDDAALKSICTEYATASMGASHPYEYNTLFGGVGIHNFGIEVAGEDGKSIVVRHAGLTLGSETVYPFVMPSPKAFKSLTVHFGVPPGLRLELHGVRLFKSGARVADLAAKELTMSSRKGVFINGELMTTSREGDTLNIGFEQEIEADQVQLILSVGKLPIVAAEGCLAD